MSKAKKDQRAEVLRILRDGPKKDEQMSDLTQVYKHAKIIAGAGGPEWKHEQVDLNNARVKIYHGVDSTWGTNNFLLEAAVVMYCGEVQNYYEGTLRWWSCRVAFDKMNKCWECAVGDTIHNCVATSFYNQLAASVALIAAVAEQIGGSDE